MERKGVAAAAATPEGRSRILFFFLGGGPLPAHARLDHPGDEHAHLVEQQHGKASRIWDTTSGGVRMAAMTATARMTYLRLEVSISTVVKPTRVVR